MEQRSPEWHQARLGKVTASRIAEVMVQGRSGQPSKTRRAYMVQLIRERLTGVPTEGFTSRAMEQGTEREPEARSFYSLICDEETALAGFIEHPSIPMAGASPDLLVGTDGLAEFKCPESHTHFDTLMGATIPRKYTDQMQWQLACTGRDWCDWVSFDPTMPPKMQMHTVRVEADAYRIKSLESYVENFLLELDTELNKARKRFDLGVAA